MRLFVVAAKARELAALDGSTTHVAMYRRDWRTGIYSLGDLAPVQAGNIVQLKSCDFPVPAAGASIKAIGTFPPITRRKIGVSAAIALFLVMWMLRLYVL